MSAEGKNTLGLALCTACSIGKSIDGDALISAAGEQYEGAALP